jgi:hypothetical protein
MERSPDLIESMTFRGATTDGLRAAVIDVLINVVRWRFLKLVRD